MAVKDILDKITERYPDVIGALVRTDTHVFHNLKSPYDMLCANTFMMTFSDIFDLVGTLEGEGFDFDELILDFEAHSFIIRAVEGGLLVMLTPQMQRAQLVKLQVGLGLFGKPIAQALKEEPADAPAPAAEDAVPAPAAAPEQPDNIAAPAQGKSGLLGFVGKRIFGDGQNAAPVDVSKARAEMENPPIGADGKPKKLKMYRGVAFYE